MSESRLWRVLVRNREAIAPDVPNDVLREIAEIEERNQYDDDRRKVLVEVRQVFEQTVREQMLSKKAQ